MLSSSSMQARLPAVAGSFYPDQPGELSTLLEASFADAKKIESGPVKALIAPHAGLIYSGPIAASAYQTLAQQAEQINRVILLGPSHRVGFHGMATCSADRYLMPSGEIELDIESTERINHLPQVACLDKAHEFEHSLEVHLPFLQRVLNDFILLPIVVGDCSAEEVAEVLELLWGGDETLIVISSDLSHYNSYSIARQQDSQTSEHIVSLRGDLIGYEDACGRNPIKGLLKVAHLKNLKPTLIDLRNSGDTAGSKDRVVGYGAYIFEQ